MVGLPTLNSKQYPSQLFPHSIQGRSIHIGLPFSFTERSHLLPEKHIIEGQDVESILDDMAPLLIGKPRVTVAIACLTAAIYLYNPNISSEGLKKAVEDISEYIYLYNQPVEKELIN